MTAVNPERPGVLYVVVPCYNEESALPFTSAALATELATMKSRSIVSLASRILFVNDGSTDATWRLIEDLHARQPETFSGLNLSRNRGHQNALLAGLLSVVDLADMTISIDADLQDPVSVMTQMVELYNDGADVVYGVRDSRRTDGFFKRFTALTFYRMMRFAGSESIFNHADCRLLSRRAVEGLAQFHEVNLFLRGLVPLIGFRAAIVRYDRAARVAGNTKYPLSKMMAFAVDGITSFSVRPIRLITQIGLLVFALSVVAIVYVIVRFLLGQTVTGWASSLLSIWALGGLVLMSIGVIGEYVAKTYMETKARPRFLIESFLDSSADSAISPPE